MNLDPVRARCFLEVVERGTVAAAAGALGYSPPAVSQQIAKLERSVGVALFDRMSGRLRPTPAARALVPHVYAVLDALEAGRRAARSAATGDREPVRVAAFPSAVVTLVAPAARRRRFPLGLIREAEDDVGLRELALGHVEVALVQEHNHQVPERDPRLAYHRLMHDPLDLVVPEGWSLPTRLADTADLPWVVSSEGSPCWRSTLDAWADAGIAPAVAGQGIELTTLLALVAGGVGVALVPRLGIPTPAAGVVVAPGASPVVRTVYAVTRRTHGQGAVADAVATLQDVAADVAARETGRWRRGDEVSDGSGPAEFRAPDWP